MNETCSWPGCNASQGRCIDGVLYCAVHYRPKLKEVVMAGIRAGVDDKAQCKTVPGWKNRFARWVTNDDCLSPGGLSKAKIVGRGFDFSINGQRVRFSIERHPAGRVCLQKWEFNAETDELQLLDESILTAEFPIDGNGDARCPKCANLLEVSAGRIRCAECGFEIQHEHTLYPR